MAENTRLISSFPSLDRLNDDDVLFCMRGSVSYKLPGSVVKTLALGGSAYIENVNGTPYWYIYDPDTGAHVQSEKAQGPEAPKISNVAIDSQYHLIVTLENGESYDAGYARGPSGDGSGDMLADDYDAGGIVKAFGGIPSYVQTVSNSMDAATSTWTYYGMTIQVDTVRCGNTVSARVSVSGAPTAISAGTYKTGTFPAPAAEIDGAEYPLPNRAGDGAIFLVKLDGDYFRVRWYNADDSTEYAITGGFTYVAEPEV